MAKKSLSIMAAGLGDNLVIKKRDPSAPAQTAPARLMEFSSAAQDWQNEIADLKNKLDKVKPGAQLFPLKKLHKVNGRQRKLSKEERADLLENLKHHPLDTPITVVKRSDGEWDIVSGNNRVDIYLELGREEIEGIEKHYTDQEANKQAFFSNLLHPSLPDYEKFIGFKLLLESDHRTQEQVAKEAGISKSTISRIMSFDKLPSEAIDLIKNNPSAIGANTAEAFVKILEDGKKRSVVMRTIKEIIDGQITQDVGIKKAKLSEVSKPHNQRPTPITIRSGKKKYCQVISTPQTLRLDFANESERIAMETAIMEMLNTRADALKN
jgi:ParB family chromosome partitioning protein